MTKNFVENYKNVETKINASKYTNELGTVTSGTRLWSSFGYFSEQTNNFNMKKVNYPENKIIYINQAYLTTKNNKKMYYADYQILGQIIEALNPPEETGDFLGFYETISFLVVRGDEEEHFLNYGFDENNSKLLYSFYKRRIRNSFGGTMFNQHRIMFKSGELDINFSKLYFFLPSITDRSEEINQYISCVNIHPFDIDEKEIGADFNPCRLDFAGEKKPQTTESVFNVLKNSRNFEYEPCLKR